MLAMRKSIQFYTKLWFMKYQNSSPRKYISHVNCSLNWKIIFIKGLWNKMFFWSIFQRNNICSSQKFIGCIYKLLKDIYLLKQRLQAQSILLQVIFRNSISGSIPLTSVRVGPFGRSVWTWGSDTICHIPRNPLSKFRANGVRFFFFLLYATSQLC